MMHLSQIIVGSVLLIFAVAIILVVLLQEGQQQNLGTLSGSADTFYSRNQGRSIDAFLARWTKVIAVFFFLSVIAMNFIALIVNPNN
ncbi:MAG: preprotein translocase subunit SecG [Oscillospiraceae bacterium]|jgi:preprotein translocase subunit SecG|nr:preprotein translocase subunit SecG [Oscillospiraceae bacterium]